MQCRFTYFVFPFLSLLMLAGCNPLLFGTAAMTTTGAVLSQERTVGSAIDDVSIKSKVSSAFLQHDVDNLFGAVNIQVSEGRVLLTGYVPSEEKRLEAGKLTWEQTGVKEVINELNVLPASDPELRDIKENAKDSWITTQIKTKLLVDKHIHSMNYSVETVNQVVYLMGIAQNQDELDMVVRIAGSVKNVKRVVSHVRMRESMLRDVNNKY